MYIKYIYLHFLNVIFDFFFFFLLNKNFIYINFLFIIKRILKFLKFLNKTLIYQ